MDMNNRRLLSIIFFLTFIPRISFCQLQEILIKQKFSSVCYIETEVVKTQVHNKKVYEIHLVNGKESIPMKDKATGSGFIVHREQDYYLVTATHVSNTTNLNTLIAIGNDYGGVTVHTIANLRYDDSTNWTNHKIGDVSALRLNPEIVERDSVIAPYSIHQIRNSRPPSERTMEVTVFGFPLGIGVNLKSIEPITKTNKISSGVLELMRFDKKGISPMFLLDDPSTSGFSGGPVFITDESFFMKELKEKNLNPVDLIGIVHGTISDGTGGKFCALTPSKLIIEVIEQSGGLTGIKYFKYSSGEKWAAIEYLNGAPFNVLYNVDKSGKPQNPGTIKDGKGTVILYDEYGNITAKSEYLDGKLVSSDWHLRYISAKEKK